jgi:hypothetical protein
MPGSDKQRRGQFPIFLARLGLPIAHRWDAALRPAVTDGAASFTGRRSIQYLPHLHLSPLPTVSGGYLPSVELPGDGARVLDNVRDRPIRPGRCHPPVSIAVGGPSRCRHEWRGILFRELPIMDVPKSAY